VSDLLLRVGIPVPPEEAEGTAARVLELVPQGYEEAAGGEVIELVTYVDAATAERIVALFPHASVVPVPAGWEDAWRAFHRPAVAGGVWLGPPWEQPPPGLPAVVIDPGRAFGTGAHATTRLCVELLAQLERGSLLDVGCGSGVLSIAGARLGYGPLLAVDSDPHAVEATLDNAAANRVDVDVRLADATLEALPAFDVAVANIALGAVEGVLARLSGRSAITAGYLVQERPGAAGWAHVARLELDGWAADHFVRQTV
jgi:ribosomal protein L11 methyltransferase